MLRLIVFDIDGTLTRTTGIDTSCYVRALSDYLGTKIDDDWSSYRNVTDSGIAAELFDQHHRPRRDLGAVQARFAALLMQSLTDDPDCCREVHGASNFLRQLRAMENVRIGVATGGWARTAHMKLRHAGIDVQGMAFASADDSKSRTRIMETCRQRAASLAGADGFAAVTYIGDGIWDAVAAAELGWHFIGIASGVDADRLRAAGAKYVFRDFAAVEQTITCALLHSSAV